MERYIDKEKGQTEELKNVITYLTKKYCVSLKEIINEPDPLLHYDISFDLLDFMYNFPWIGCKFHEYPEDFLHYLRVCFISVQNALYDNIKQSYQGSVVKQYVDIRLINVPPLPEVKVESIRNLRDYHVSKYVTIFGTVIRTTNVKNRELQKDFECKKCGKIYKAYSDIFEFSKMQLPPVCGAEVEKQGNPFMDMMKNMIMKKKAKNNPDGEVKSTGGSFSMVPCSNRQFAPMPNTSIFSDYQEIKVQELFKTLKPGNIPRSILVVLEDNLVDMCKPGDDVLINGILIQRWKSYGREDRPLIDIAILANNIIVLNKKEFIQKFDVTQENKAEFKKFWKENQMLEGRNKLIEAICPYIYEKNEQKLGMLLAIIGGVPKLMEQDNTRIRGQIHMLMVGEPGTGKSCLLCFAQKLSMRSVMTTGIGTTSAGLTVAAFKDGNEWILEAGALVLADCGVCCIDEFALIKPEDRGSVHEAMEQQTLSIAKAGLVCKINARATILAATNPSNTTKIDMNYNNFQNTGIASSLLSRFDLIFVMKDEHLTEYDQAHANFKLSMNRENEDVIDQSLWGVDKLSKYILFIQREFNPEVSDESARIFQNYYQFLRKRERLPKDRKTIRMLESLIRISEAHARLMMREEIIVLDAIMTIILMEHCLNSGLLEELFPVIMSYERYQEAKHEILLRLGLNPGDFPDPVIHKRKGNRKRTKTYEEFNVDHFMTERSEFNGFISSQDERPSMTGCGGPNNNFYIDSSQNSTQQDKRGMNSQSTFTCSQPAKRGRADHYSEYENASTRTGEIDMDFLEKEDLIYNALNDKNIKNSSNTNSNQTEDGDDPDGGDLIDLTSLINP